MQAESFYDDDNDLDNEEDHTQDVKQPSQKHKTCKDPWELAFNI